MSSIRVGLIILSAVALVSCSSTQAQHASAETTSGGRGGSPGGIPVVTAMAAERSMPVTLDAVGTAEAISTVDIRAQISGQLQQVLFEAGDDVKKGQPLFTIDRRPLE